MLLRCHAYEFYYALRRFQSLFFMPLSLMLLLIRHAIFDYFRC